MTTRITKCPRATDCAATCNMPQSVDTPWGQVQQAHRMMCGVVSVSTASHGGLHLSDERWNQLPPDVRDTMLHHHFAEEDMEALIVMCLLDHDYGDIDLAMRHARRYEQYHPVLPHLAQAAATKTQSIQGE